MYLAVDRRADGDLFSIVPHGEIDAGQAAVLDSVLEEVRASSATSVRVDLSGITFMDSTGLAWLVRLRREAVSGGTFSLSGVSDFVRRMLKITGLTEMLMPDGARSLPS